MKKKQAYRFRVELMGSDPLIWRVIEVPDFYTFWDLHVALQDALGWLDYHLHNFLLFQPGERKPLIIGIPPVEHEDDTLPGWEIPLSRFFKDPGTEAVYDYDFGDGWRHRVILEGINLQEPGRQYPACLSGERACPPEDCGGLPGFYDLLDILKDQNHAEYEDMQDWLKNHAKDYTPYDPDHFDPAEIHFDDPRKRWEQAFQEE